MQSNKIIDRICENTDAIITNDAIFACCINGSKSLFIVSIGTSDKKANCPEKWQSFGGSLELTEGWPKNILKAIKWSKRKGTTGKLKHQNNSYVKKCLLFRSTFQM